MTEVTTRPAPTAEPFATLVLERRHAEVLLSDLVSYLGSKGEDLNDIASPDSGPEEVAECQHALREMAELEVVLEQTGLWHEPHATTWPQTLTANRDWLRQELLSRLEADAGMVVNATDRSLRSKGRYIASAQACHEMLEQLGVELEA